MEISQIIPHIEVLIFASDKPLTSAELLELVNGALGFLEDKASEEQVAAATEAIREKYSSEFYPFEIKESGGGWQFLTKKEYHKTVAVLGGDKFLKRLSPAAMETLAIIAYKQPITKGEIEAIRGVSSDYSVQKLLEKELIVITGRNEEMPGKPLVYSTSKTFMDYFGLNNASELPTIKEILMDQAVTPYVVTENHPVETDRMEEFASFSVNGSGDLIDQEVGEETDRKRPGSGYEGELESSHAEEETPEDRVEQHEAADAENGDEQQKAAGTEDADKQHEAADTEDGDEQQEGDQDSEDADDSENPESPDTSTFEEDQPH
jgi:segregation and condensation protein B